MTPEEQRLLAEKLGNEASAAMKRELAAYDEKAIKFANAAAEGKISKEAFEEYKTAANGAMEALKSICEKQGTSLTELATTMSAQKTGIIKSISEILKENESDLLRVKSQGSGTKSFMIDVTAKGGLGMVALDGQNKAVGPVAEVSGINGGTAASIFQNIDAASLLRLGGDSAIFSQYRNVPWIYDLCNIINAGYDTMMAMWYEEQAKTGSSATVAEGVSKPMSQYAYQLNTSPYKKEATLIGFTEEWQLDFPRLQSDILGKGRLDLVNRINTVVLQDIFAASTAYNTATSYTGGTPLSQYNDYLAIDACAAQVDNATFGATRANGAIMSTFKKHRLGTQLDSEGRFLMPPPALSDMTYIGNPAVSANGNLGNDGLIVGDFRQYNIILRGGLILRIGYNGTDFAQNMFSVVLEQFYFDYIPTVRKVAIVSGSTFGAVKTSITT